MAYIKPIRSEADYRSSLARVDALMDRDGRSAADSEELAVLADLVEGFERKHFPIELPTPVEAIRFRMEQLGLEPRDLAPHIGSRGKVSEVLSGKRPLTLAMIRALHRNLNIPADVLLQEQVGHVDACEIATDDTTVDWERLPLLEMAKLGWIKASTTIRGHAEEIGRMLVAAAGGLQAVPAPLCRRSERIRPNAKADIHALFAWTLKVLAEARAETLPAQYRHGTVTAEFLTAIAHLSAREDGPLAAREKLRRHGIHFVIVPHLRRTYLDGAALTRADTGSPVIALTLRHDRVDNFWFCLLHELAHVGRHISAAAPAFMDDMDLRGTPSRNEDPREREADEDAEEALIPRIEWAAAKLTRVSSYARLTAVSQRLGIHPAIVAGRLRYETKDYRKFAPLLGSGEVSRILA